MARTLRRALILAAGTLALAAAPGRTADLRLEFLFGAPLNLPAGLTISQAGHPDLRTTAHWCSEPFRTPFYYAARISYWRHGAGWGVDLLHHKLFLDEPPSAVQRFSITHGFNLLTLQRLWMFGGNVVSIGAGLVVAHPESEVRGRVLAQNGGLGLPGTSLPER